MENNLQVLILLLLFIINTLLSVYNCWAVGRFWTEKRLLPLWPRIMCWCGAIMATCGFYWVYSVMITFALLHFGYLSIEGAGAIINLGYLIIIFPVLGTGALIWVDSAIKAYQQRNFHSTGVAVWNTYAQARNTISAVQHVPDALSEVLRYFGKAISSGSKSKKGSEGIVVLLVVILAIILGILTTAYLINKFDRMVELDMNNPDAHRM